MNSTSLYAIIDVETTGGMVGNSRITEIAIFLTDGEEVLDEFSTLLNPEIPIPYFITQLTGIDDHMVADAPSFSEVADRILTITEGAVFVAHNVNFDYGMIRNEFRRLDHDFRREKLCTVQLGRKFLPGYKSYGLGKITQELGIPIHARHRARGDAEATVRLFQIIYKKAGGGLYLKVDKALIDQMPDQIDDKALSRVPEKGGIYRLYDDNGVLLYLGHGDNLFKEVVKHLKPSKSPVAMELRSRVIDFDFQQIPSPLIRELMFHTELGLQQPIFNRTSRTFWTLEKHPDLFGVLHLGISKCDRGSGLNSFRSKKDAAKYLNSLILRHRLCPKYIDHKSKAFPTHEKVCICGGICRDQESVRDYNSRVEAALSQKDLKDFVIVDRGDTKEWSFVMVENHRFLGYGTLSSDVAGHSFDQLKPYLQKHQHGVEPMYIINEHLSRNKHLQIIRKAV